jgi:hypothetical protein
MIKNIISILILFVFCFANSTCKKIWRYPISMYGRWVSYSECGMEIDIQKNGKGRYFSNHVQFGCDGKSWKGTVRYTDDHLWVGITKFTFVEKPLRLSGLDTIKWGGGAIKYPKLASMTLQNSKLHTGEIIEYTKIEDY